MTTEIHEAAMTAADITTETFRPRRRRLARYIDTCEMRKISRLATPIALVAMVNMAMSITDTFMVAALGSQAMAAVAIGSDFYSILFYLATGLLAGLSPAYAEAWAKRDYARLARLRTVGWMLLAAAAVPVIPAIWFAPNYLGALGIDQGLLLEGTGYTRAMALTLLPMLAVTFYRNRLTALEKPGLILKITLGIVPLNAGLNWVFIYGAAGFDGMGATGAGVASCLSAICIAMGLAWLAWRAEDRGLACWIDFAEFRSAVRIGWPIGIATLAEVGIFLGATLFIAAIAPQDTAAHAIVLRLAGFTYAIPVGLLQAAMVRMARLGVDARRAHRRRVIASATVIALVSGGALFLALAALALPLSEVVMGNQPDAAVLTRTLVMLILILAAIEIAEPLGTTSAGLLRGCDDTCVPMIISLFGNWGVSLPLGLVLCLGFETGAIGVWVGMGIGNITASLFMFVRVRHYWQR
ncbi:MATE family efflux transporter [Ruegeria sp. HKCCD4332]|uniref:MATE family efflux transporter n=2 Tax=unclassified Ruegeria TaxID=2625375 RepID=UPI0014929D5A|nr:MATE family efflux transporter [Ruegeria sp. HKCCD4332]NOD78480.1 MATE family efflux transporter [Ruegeria sp. HKCCD4332]